MQQVRAPVDQCRRTGSPVNYLPLVNKLTRPYNGIVREPRSTHQVALPLDVCSDAGQPYFIASRDSKATTSSTVSIKYTVVFYIVI